MARERWDGDGCPAEAGLVPPSAATLRPPKTADFRHEADSPSFVFKYFSGNPVVGGFRAARSLPVIPSPKSALFRPGADFSSLVFKYFWGNPVVGEFRAARAVPGSRGSGSTGIVESLSQHCIGTPRAAWSWCHWSQPGTSPRAPFPAGAALARVCTFV